MSEQKATSIGFSKRNFVIMGIGVLIVALSYFLVAGGRSAKDSFDSAQIFSFVRITLAPIMIFAGFAIIGWGILAKNPEQSESKAH